MKRTWFAANANRLVLLGVGLATATGVVQYRRGTHLSPPTTPVAAADGARCGLIGPHRVRCQVIASASVDRVWQLLTDYPRYPDLFHSAIFRFELTRQEPGDKPRLIGAVSGFAQRWPFDIEMTQARSPQSSTLAWEQLSGSLSNDRGSWLLQPRSTAETLITYEIEVAMVGVPAFIINDVLLDNLPGGIENLADVAAAGAP